MIEVTLYSRQDCHLCELALDDLNALQDIVPHELKIVDVDSDRKLQREYGFEVPVIIIGPYTLRAPIETKDLEISLRAAAMRQNQEAKIDQAITEGRTNVRLIWNKADRFSLWLSRHYLAVLNVIIMIYVGLPFLAPIMMNNGWTTPANWIYRGYSLVCHQLSYRSFFLFGEQLTYPLTIAGIEGSKPLAAVVDFAENDILLARSYIGDDHVGFKVALCERDIAIYLGILLFGLIFAVSHRKIPKLPWYLWIILALVPIGVDGLSQLVTQFSSVLPDRESTPLLRAITGFLFGIFSCWFFYPMVEESMQESREFLESKYDRFRKQQAYLRTRVS